ncbi:MAG: hypothetical protein RJB03_356, partial [Bacteroidota bacterium]
MNKTIAIVGIGLIGGSVALKCKRAGFAAKVMGVDNNPDHCKQALELGLVDEVLSLEDAMVVADLIILAIPVGAIASLLPGLLDKINTQVVIDMGSTKSLVTDLVAGHPQRGRFVASHPMWGTEYSGPTAAVENGFEQKAVILCDVEKTDADALDTAHQLFNVLQMRIIQMNAKDHDVHAAYVSHISHITSFAL